MVNNTSNSLARQYDIFATTMDNEKCRVLIQLYGAKDFLWNSKSQLYHNKSMREDACNEISSVMSIPVPELKKKMTTLQASYRREKSRIAKSLITGSGTHQVYVSKWFAFDNFGFMKDKAVPNETSETMPEDILTTQNVITFENNDVEPNAPSATDSTDKHVEKPTDIYKATNIPTVKNIKRKKNTEESPMLKKAFQILNEISLSTDSYSTYGQHIANELRKYDQRTLIYVKNAINNVIFQADLGCYSPNYGHGNYYNTTQNSTPSPQTPIPSP
ncbi:uncharacterized protein LOC126903409 [Daktulosphaira vitifoliae]|uniref:uncharacterized protein LOC126903409 n=1 Tax=Daktulosphaira vitifoliae TaxID=58002 RepID=UPI0021AA9B66|nr:uncharacterized protein LOC126903409 [Daktulosphaira vitifoliae]